MIDPLRQLEHDVAHATMHAGLGDYARDPFTVAGWTHAKRSVEWIRRAIRGEVALAVGLRLAWLEAALAHRYNPIRYWPVLCLIGQHQFDDHPAHDVEREVAKLERRLRAN